MTLISEDEVQSTPPETPSARSPKGMRLWLFLLLTVALIGLIGGSVATAHFSYTETIASAETSQKLANRIKRDERKVERVTHQLKEYGFDVSADD